MKFKIFFQACFLPKKNLRHFIIPIFQYSIIPLLFFFLVVSCKKEKSTIVFTDVSPGTDFNIYAVRKLTDDTLMACGGKDNKGIVLRSADKGTSWSVLNDSFDQVIYDFYFINDHLGFAGGGTPDVFKTTDGGKNWEKLYLPFPLTGFPPNYRSPLRKIFFVNDSLGFICGGGKFEAGIIFKTADQGLNWTLTTFQYELRGILFLNDQTGYACGFGVMLKTTDSGNNWTVIKSPNEFYTSLMKYPDDIYTSGYNGGIYKTSIADIDWQPVNSSNNAYSSRSHFNLITSSANGTLIAAGDGGFISISTDQGSSWDEGESFNGVTIKSILTLDNHSGIAAGNDGKIFKFSW
ncbi:MAG: YCF48-related protein [Bacteroidota bacterium]